MATVSQFISEVIVKDQASAVADRVTGALDRLKKTEEQLQETTARSTRTLESSARQFERLKASVDPVYQAQQRLAEIQNQLNRSVQLGVATQKEANDVYNRYVANQNTATAATSGFGTALNSVRGVLGAFGIALSAVQLVRFAQDAFTAAAGLAEQAEQLGFGVRALQAYQYAATQVGVSQETMNTALARFTRTVGEAAGGSQKAIDAFDDIGVKILDTNGNLRDNEELLLDVAQAISGISDPSRQAAASVEFFSRGGQKLLTFLGLGAEGIEHFADEMDRLGLGLTEEQARIADQSADELAKLAFAFEKMAQSLVVDLLPPLTAFVNKLAELIEMGPSLSDIADLLTFSPGMSLILGRNFSFSDDFQPPGGTGGSPNVMGSSSRGGPPVRGAARPGGASNPQSDAEIARAAAEAAAAAAKLQAAYEALRDELLPLDAVSLQYAKDLDTINKAVAAGITSQEAAAVQTALLAEKYRDLLDPLGTTRRALEDEAAALMLTDKEREIATRLLSIEQDLREKGVLLSQQQREELEAELRLIQQRTEANKDSADAEKKRQQDAERAMKERVRLAEQEAELLLEPFKNAANNIQDAFSEAFRSILDGGTDSFKDLALRVVDIMREMASQVTALMVFRPLLQSAVGNMTGSGAGAGGGGFDLGSIFGGGGSGFDLSQMFGGGSSGIPTIARGGQGVPGGTGPGGGGFSWGGAGLTAAMNLIPLGLSFLSGDKVGGGQIGGAVGGTLGGIAGSFFGPVGSMVGSMLGNLLGSLVGGLFGGGFKKPSASGYFNVQDNAGFLTDSSAKNGGDSQTGRDAVNAYSQTLNALLTQTDLSIMNGRLSGYIQAQQNKDGETNFYGNLAVGQNGGPASQDYYTRVALGGSTRKGEEGLKQVVADLIKETLRQAANTGALGGAGATGTMLTVLRNSKAGSVEGLGADIEFARAYDQLIGIAAETTEYAEAVKALNRQFDAAEAKATELGLALQPLIDARPDAIAKLTTDFNNSIEDQILAITDPMALAMKQLAEFQADRLKEATAAGANLVEVERLSGLERERIVQQFQGQAQSTLQAFYDAITFGPLSGRTASGQLSGAQAAFQTAAERAAQGDFSAQASLAGLGTQFLGASNAVYANGPQHAANLELVRQTVALYLGGPQASVSQTITQTSGELARLFTINNKQIENLLAEIAALREENSSLNAQLRRFISQQGTA